MKLSDIRAALAELSLHPSKSLGQNFLADTNMARWTVEQLELGAGDLLLLAYSPRHRRPNLLNRRICRTAPQQNRDDGRFSLVIRMHQMNHHVGRSPVDALLARTMKVELL